MMMTRPDGRRDIRSGSRTYGSRASTAVAAQRRALRMAARDTRLLGIPRMSQSYGGMRSGVELKGMDTNWQWVGVLATTNTNAQIQTCNLIQTGTGSWNRIGRKTVSKSLRLQGYLECSHILTAGGDLSSNMVRLTVVWDRQPAGGAEPLFNDIFGNTNQSGTETTAFFSPPKYDTMGRFVVLKDMLFISDPKASTPAAGDIVVNTIALDEYLRLPNLESNYSGQSTPMTIADINSGALYVTGRALRQDAAETQWTATIGARLRYID